MTLPTPEDPAQAPVWAVYVNAQLIQASLGIIPSTVLALGVRISEDSVTVHCQLRAMTEEGDAGLDEIVKELQRLLGSDIRVDRVHEVCSRKHISPFDEIFWSYTARQD